MHDSVIYTIGHSTHDPDRFLEMLQTYGIDSVIDIRSVAYSKYNPQFNEPFLHSFLKKKGIIYMNFSKEFGARKSEPELLDEAGQLDFARVQKSEAFNKGMDRILKGIRKGFRIALMSSKGDPLLCHRFSMVSVILAEKGLEVRHILPDKSWISQQELEDKLLQEFEDKLPQPDMFDPDVSKTEQLAKAYKLKNHQIGFAPQDKK